METHATPINEVVTLLEKKSYLRHKLFQLFAINSIEGMKFYYHMGEKAQQPVLGKLYKKLMETYYKYVHTSAVKLPLKDMEAFIRGASHLSVGPCPCRLIFDKETCEAPIFTCIRVNYFSQTVTELQDMVNDARAKKGLKPKKAGKELTTDEAVDLVRHAYGQNLVLSLESCIQPYQNNICACCPDCCIELNLRYKFGLDVCKSGPYFPVLSSDTCTGCGDCGERCPVDAIAMAGGIPSINPGTCLGCGHCAEACPTDSMVLEINPERVPAYKEPGILKTGFVLALTGMMYILFRRYTATHKSENYKYGKAKPRTSDLIRP